MSVNGVFGFDFFDSVEVSCCSDNFLCDQVNFGFGFGLPFATLEPIAFVSLLNEKTRLPVSLLVTSFVAARFGCPPIEKIIWESVCKDEIDRSCGLIVRFCNYCLKLDRSVCCQKIWPLNLKDLELPDIRSAEEFKK